MQNVTNLDDYRKGWVCLHRRIMDNPLFRDNPDARHLFTDLLVLAAWADTEQDWRGKPVIVLRGQVMISERRLAKVVGLTYQKTRTIIAHMVQHNIIKINAASNAMPSLVTICNFGKYQDYQRNDNAEHNATLTQSQRIANAQNNKETIKQDNKTETNQRSTSTPRAEMSVGFEDKNLSECKKAFNGNTDRMLETVMSAMAPYGERSSAAQWLSTVMNVNGAEAVALAFQALETARAENKIIPRPLPWLSKTATAFKNKPQQASAPSADWRDRQRNTSRIIMDLARGGQTNGE
jgi:hypothetical protein